MTQFERMIRSLPYKCDKECKEFMNENKRKLYEYNNLPFERLSEQQNLLKNILGKTGEGIYIEQPFHCDYGKNIEVGNHFYANYNLIILDVAPVKIGDNVMCAPNVGIYTAGHPIHPAARATLWEYGIEITIGDNVWIGANACILPGVHIGSNTVIGAGSVVTKDIPEWTVAAGNPCKPIRAITDEDKKYYFQKREFDFDIFNPQNNVADALFNSTEIPKV